MPYEQKLLKRREMIKRIAMAGTAPAVVALISGTAGRLSAGGSKSGPPPVLAPAAPEPGTIVLTGLGIAGAVAVTALRKKKTPPDSGSKS